MRGARDGGEGGPGLGGGLPRDRGDAYRWDEGMGPAGQAVCGGDGPGPG